MANRHFPAAIPGGPIASRPGTLPSPSAAWGRTFCRTRTSPGASWSPWRPSRATSFWRSVRARRLDGVPGGQAPGSPGPDREGRRSGRGADPAVAPGGSPDHRRPGLSWEDLGRYGPRTGAGRLPIGQSPYNIASPLMWEIVSRTDEYARAAFVTTGGRPPADGSTGLWRIWRAHRLDSDVRYPGNAMRGGAGRFSPPAQGRFRRGPVPASPGLVRGEERHASPGC